MLQGGLTEVASGFDGAVSVWAPKARGWAGQHHLQGSGNRYSEPGISRKCVRGSDEGGSRRTCTAGPIFWTWNLFSNLPR